MRASCDTEWRERGASLAPPMTCRAVAHVDCGELIDIPVPGY
jgi:hypothetical protein